MNHIKKHMVTIILMVMMLFGFGLLAYPSIANYYNSMIQQRAIGSYVHEIVQMDRDRYKTVREDAENYNKEIAEKGIDWMMSDEQMKAYEAILKPGESGAMGYIVIPKIHESLTIYHGTSDEVLQTGIGHLAGTSLPIGGETSHCVLSGHRGLPSAKLFSDLDKLVEGDTFTINTLDMTLTYQVDQIRVVTPENLSDLKLEEGKDLCTLVTCTPYGINTHRLLVRGHRVDNANGNADVIADAIQIETIYIAPFIAGPILALLLIIMLITTGKNRKKTGNRKEQNVEKMLRAYKDRRK